MLHHLTLWVPDLDRAAASWQWLLHELGFVQDPAYEQVMLFRHESGYAFVLEQSRTWCPACSTAASGPG